MPALRRGPRLWEAELARVLGLDPGEKRIGVALSDALGIIAQPHQVIDAKAGNPIDAIRRLCAEYEVTTIVIGLPVSLSGEEGPAAVRAREFGLRVGKATECEIVFYDERFTTVQAEAAMLEAGVKRRKRRGAVDKVAAAVMLQGYLDQRRRDDS